MSNDTVDFEGYGHGRSARRVPPVGVRRRAAWMTLFLLPACLPADPFAEALAYGDPVGTREGLFYPDGRTNELVAVRPGDEALEVERVTLGSEQTKLAWARPTRDGSGLLALTIPTSPKFEKVGHALHRFDAALGADSVQYDVEAPFDGLALSPDLRHAVLYFTGSGTGEPLQNANPVAVVDLEGSATWGFTLNGFGGTLSWVEFPAQLQPGVPTPVQVGSAARDLVAFLAAGEVVLADMADPSADQVAVRFDDAAAFRPAETMLRPGNDAFPDPVLFVRGDGADDVAMLTLVDHPDEVTAEPGFTAVVSLLPVPRGAGAMVPHDGDVPYLVTLSAGELRFTDIGTLQAFDVPFDASATQMYVRQHERAPNDFVDQIVAWAPFGNIISTLTLDGIENSLGRKPHELYVQAGIVQLRRLDNDRILVSSGQTLYVVDISLDQVTPLTTQSTYDANASALDGNALLLGTPGEAWISAVNLMTLDPKSMLLDEPVVDFFYAAGPRKIMVTHEELLGYVTVADPQDLSRETAYVEWGYLARGILDREVGK
jgi:hypothetical protein